MFQAPSKLVACAVLCFALAHTALAQTATRPRTTGTSVGASAGTWAKQPAGTMAWLRSVFFLDQNRGWAAGSKGTLLRTDDGGKTWQERGASTRDIVRDVFFVD